MVKIQNLQMICVFIQQFISLLFSGKDPRLYECPIYRKPQRSPQGYIGSVDLDTDVNPKLWTLRGVALLCDIQ
jgi:hypothetical protein